MHGRGGDRRAAPSTPEHRVTQQSHPILRRIKNRCASNSSCMNVHGISVHGHRKMETPRCLSGRLGRHGGVRLPRGTAVGRGKALTPAAPWMALEDVALREVRPTRKRVIPPIANVQNGHRRRQGADCRSPGHREAGTDCQCGQSYFLAWWPPMGDQCQCPIPHPGPGCAPAGAEARSLGPRPLTGVCLPGSREHERDRTWWMI